MSKYSAYLDHFPEGQISKIFHRLHDGDWVHETIQDCTDIAEANKVRRNHVDPWNADKLNKELSYEGLDVIKFPQNMQNLSPPTKELDGLLRDRRLMHGGHPVLRWNAANLTVKMDYRDNVLPIKAHAKHRIDGIIALIMGLAVSFNAETGASVYENEGAMEL